jgi:hypothetical protein
MEGMQERLYEYIGGTLRAQNGHAIEIGGVEDHVHILAGLSPSLSEFRIETCLKMNIRLNAVLLSPLRGKVFDGIASAG